MRVLIVDDDDQIRIGLQRTLGRLGYEVLVSSNGEDGLKLAATAAPAVILTDIRLPGMDGHTFARRIKALGLDASLIVMSAHGEMDDVIDAVRTGAMDYLRKPWSFADLSAAVIRGVELFESRRAKQPAAPATSPVASELSLSWILKRIQSGEILLPAIPAVTGGRNIIQVLAETVAANELFPIKAPELASVQAKIRNFSVARALAMRALAANLPGEWGIDPGTAYQVGIFADVGASFLLWTLSERTPIPPVPECLSFIRENHTAIGSLILLRWGVDRATAMLARLHHTATLPEPRDPYCTLEVVAASLAERLVPDGDVTSKALRPDTLLRESRALLNLSVVTQHSILAQLAPELKQVLDGLNEGRSPGR